MGGGVQVIRAMPERKRYYSIDVFPRLDPYFKNSKIRTKLDTLEFLKISSELKNYIEFSKSALNWKIDIKS